jgi:hypothetical protein
MAKQHSPKHHVIATRVDDRTRLHLEHRARERETTLSDFVSCILEDAVRAPSARAYSSAATIARSA